MGMKRALYTNKNIENVHWNDVKHGDKQQNSTISTISSDFLLPRFIFQIQLGEYININYKFFLNQGLYIPRYV